MNSSDHKWIAGLALGGGLLYLLTRRTESASSSGQPAKPATTPGPRPTKPRSSPRPTYRNPRVRDKPGTRDEKVVQLTKGWVWPVEVETRPPHRPPVVSDGFHFRPSANRWHQGVDIMYKRSSALPKSRRNPDQTKWFDMWPGTRVVATGPGRVVAAGRIKTGGRVRIEHAGGVVSAYYHLDTFAVKKGQRIERGQVLGTVGVSRVRHLHFELWEGFPVRVLNPGAYLSAWSLARLRK